MTFSRNDPRPKLTVRLNPDLKDDLKELAENNGESMSEIARKAISREVNGVSITTKSGVVPPYEKDLREAWEFLDSIAGESGEIEYQNALIMLSQNVGKPKNVLQESVIKPLQNRGYLRVYPRVDAVMIRLQVRL